jgi:nitroreductase
MNKSYLFFAIILILGASFLPAQSADNPAMGIIVNNFSARNYAITPITRAELDLIVQAGVRAPSAANRQPWHFTVVQNETLARQLVPAVSAGNALIVISGAGDGKTNGAVILDCALATQSMYLAAQAIGLGSKIYTGPVRNINAGFKSQLGLPSDHSVVAVVRIGRLPAGVDAVSSASARRAADQTVFYR